MNATSSVWAQSSPEPTAAGDLRLVSFMVAGAEYAMPVERVREIVQMPERVGTVPGADTDVVGMMTLRRQVLPMVCLRRAFGLADRPDGAPARVLVIADETVMIGMVIDAVREVLSVDHGCIDRVPALLARNGGTVGIEAICRLGDGERLVSVLSADGLLNRATAADAGSGDAEGGDADGEDEQFVVFRLASEEYGVPVADVQEIVRVPDDLTHLPRTASHIEGVVNLRGSVLPVINQRRRFGLPTVERNDRQRIVVLTAGNVRTGIIVDSVTEVLKIARAAIGPAPDRIAGAVSRVANLAAQSRLVLLLEVGRLLEAKI